MIQFRDVHKAFAGKQVLRGLDLEIRRGEVLFIIGTSGVGKSVTIMQLMGFVRIDAGQIWFDGERIDRLSERDFYRIRKRMGMVFQHPTLFDSMTLRENVALPLRKHRGMRYREAMQTAGELLARVYLQDFVDQYPTALGNGLRKRAAIARTLALAPEVMLFDEPTTGLAPVSARRIDKLIREVADSLGVTIVVVSHDIRSIFAVADRIAFLYQGRVHLCGSPAEFRASADPIVRQFIEGRSDGPMETPGF